MRSRWRNFCGLLMATELCAVLSSAAQLAKPAYAAPSMKMESSPSLPFTERHISLHAPYPGWELGAVSGVAASADGTLYLIQRGNKADPILLFDRQGKLLRSWGKGDFTLPHSIRLDSSGNIWAVDAGASRVIKYSPTGKKLLSISVGQGPDNGSPFRGATDVAFAPNGHVYISDGYSNARILEYTSNGRKLREWGHPGTGSAEFHLPHAIQISHDGKVYVADRENGRIETFDLNGKLVGEITGLGRCYALKLDQGALWVSTSPIGEDPGAPGWLVKLDPVTGAFLGHVDVPEEREGHALDLLPSGEPIVTAGNGLLLFQK